MKEKKMVDVGIEHLRFALTKMPDNATLELNLQSVMNIVQMHDEQKKRIAELSNALQFYGRSEHWMAISSLGVSQGPRNLLVGQRGDMGSLHGWVVAQQALMK